VNAALAENLAKPVVDSGDVSAELRLPGRQAANGRDPSVRRVRALDDASGQAVEHQGQSRVTAFGACSSGDRINLK